MMIEHCLRLSARPMPPKRPRLSASAELESEDISSAIAAAKEKVADAVDSLQSLVVALDARKAALDEKERKQRLVEEEMAMNRERVGSIIKLNLRGRVFKTYKETLLKLEDTYFFRMLSSGQWQPDEEGEYFIDTRYEGFERVLAYLSSGELSVEGLNEYEKKCVSDNLDYFQIPYSEEWSYSTYSDLQVPRANDVLCELSDGRLCGSIAESVVVWNMNNGSVELTLTGHTGAVWEIIQLVDGRISSCSADFIIKVWNLETETCELTLVGHTNEVNRIAQLSDGRLCSGSDDSFIRVWNLDSGLCEQTIDTEGRLVYSFAQLSDGRLCAGYDTGRIDLWNVESGVCELSLEGHTSYVFSIVAIAESRICSCSSDYSVKVWNVSSAQCERTIVGHTDAVYSMVRMRDGRLCSVSYDGTIRIWNADTGDCEKVLKADDSEPVYRVLQLQDGRLVARVGNGMIRIWS